MRKYAFSPILLAAFVFSILTAGPLELSTTNNTNIGLRKKINNTVDNWLSIENANFVIYYKAGFLPDANLMLNYCEFARNITMNLYPHSLPFKVTVKLYDINTWPYSIGTTMASVSSTSAELSFLSPSDVPAQYRSYIDNLWYQKNTVHEYVHVPTYVDLFSKTWYRNGGLPGFFDVAEYFSVFCTTPEILQKYNYYIEDMKNSIIKGSIFFMDFGPYRWGAYVAKYMYEYYGKDRVHALFKTNTTYFWDAVAQALGVSPSAFEINWAKWIYKELGYSLPSQYQTHSLDISLTPGGTTNPPPGLNPIFTGFPALLIAKPDNNYRFLKWTGDVSAEQQTNPNIVVIMDSDRGIKANFLRLFIFTIQTGIGGTTDPTSGTYTYDIGTIVNIRAMPISRYEFVQWTGNIPSGREKDNPISISADSDKTITANFARIVYPPTSLTGQKVLNRSLSQAEYINVLTWNSNPNNENIVAYRIYLIEGNNQKFIGEVNSTTFRMQIRKVDRNKVYTYSVLAVNNENREGDPAYVTIR